MNQTFFTDATRRVYVRKLQRLAGQLPSSPHRAPEVDGDEDEEEPLQQTTPPRQRPKTATTRSPPTASGYAYVIMTNIARLWTIRSLVCVPELLTTFSGYIHLN